MMSGFSGITGSGAATGQRRTAGERKQHKVVTPGGMSRDRRSTGRRQQHGLTLVDCRAILQIVFPACS